MHRFKRLVTIGTATLALAGISAGAAGAIGYNGGPFAATSPGDHVFTLGGFYDIECPSVSATGNATGSDTVSLTMSFTGCDFLGFPATVSASAPWSFQLIKPPPPPGVPFYLTALTWTTGMTTTITIPIAGCSVVFAGAQIFSHGAWGNHLISETQTSGVEIVSTVDNAYYTASGCPFSSSTNGRYTGTFFLPGIAIY